MRELLIKWLNEGLALQSGEELYIPTDSRANQTDLYQILRKELGVLRSIDAEESAKLRIFTTYKDAQYWVVIKKISLTPLVAFKKGVDGKVSKVVINNDKSTRIKRLKEMDIKDTYETLNNLPCDKH